MSPPSATSAEQVYVATVVTHVDEVSTLKQHLARSRASKIVIAGDKEADGSHSQSVGADAVQSREGA